MEVLKDKIEKFLDINNNDGYGINYGYGYVSGSGGGNGSGGGTSYGDGYGYGNGSGCGYGNGSGNSCLGGSGNGDGNGSGYGFGNGCNNGDGHGEGDGDGDVYSNAILEINGMTVHHIDSMPCIITSIKGNIAKGYTIRKCIQLIPCFIAKVGNFFAHGETSHEALQDAQEKYEESIPIEERISNTLKKYPTLDTLVDHAELFSLHHILTGSCKFGREEFCRTHGLDPNNGKMTMREFLVLTKDSYGSSAIHQTAKAYGLEL